MYKTSYRYLIYLYKPMCTWLEQRVIFFCLVFSLAVCPSLSLYLELCVLCCLVCWLCL